MRLLKIKVKENVKVKENILNLKYWFNGVKTFFSVKVLPPIRK